MLRLNIEGFLQQTCLMWLGESLSTILIAIPTYNSVSSIDLTLKSCLEQTTIANIVISDNCSTDGTFEHLVKKYGHHSNIQIVQTSENVGRIGNWNHLLDEFQKYDETFIKFLFAGEELFPDCIKACEEVLEANRNVAAIAFEYLLNTGDSERISSEGLSGHLSSRTVDRLNLIHGGFLGSIVSNVYSKDAIGNLRFNPIFVGKTDFDFSVLMGRSAHYISRPLARSNIQHRKTFNSAWDYWFESESAFNRSYWLEKQRKSLTSREYECAKFQIFSDFVERNGSHYSFFEFVAIHRIVIRIMKKKIFEKFKSKFSRP
jgi:glycosyltransferase involved in cell wall biosynthesis